MRELTASAAGYFQSVYRCEGVLPPLADVRIYPASDHLCQAFGARALTIGTEIHFRSGEFAPRTRQGFWLLAHEVAHVVQQFRGPVTSSGAVGPCDAPEETEASAAADAALAGLPFEFAQAAARDRTPHPVVQRYMAWEHLILGSVGPVETRQILGEAGKANREQPATALSALLEELGRDADDADAGRINATYEHAAAVTLPGSGIVVTLGELSILPDYLSRPDDIADAPAEFVLPLIQSLRTWNIKELRRAAGEKPGKPKLKAALSYPNLGSMAEIAEALQIDLLGRRCGIPKWERYSSVVARNAGHFAPFSWYRWQDHHLRARETARQAHAAKDSAERDRLAARAWIYAGYADHFLHDSFAAGHLVNKTLIMQWYAEWLANSRLPVPGRRFMTAMIEAAQPALHGPGYYRPVPAADGERLVPAATPGAPAVTDPQAAAEAAALDGRIAAAGIIAKNDAERSVAYAAYLAFLRSTLTQSAAGAIHAYLNRNSLIVAAGPAGDAFRLHGDWRLLDSADATARAAEAAWLSRQAVADVLADGRTDIASREIFARFPDHVEVDGVLLSIPEWHEKHLRDRCFGDFFRMKSTRNMRFGTTVAYRHLGMPSADCVNCC
ncbi:MAG TPA: DUF4157 domain-containing protein [Trebonia sp.]|nr:DUF4157 domain-containing protein [Trebonia sp.]